MTEKKPDPEQTGRIWEEGLAAREELCSAAAAAAEQPTAASSSRPERTRQPVCLRKSSGKRNAASDRRMSSAI